MWHAQRMLRNLRSRPALEGRAARQHQDGRIRPKRGQSVPKACPSRGQSVPKACQGSRGKGLSK